jgi:UDP-N-acetyl-2-amino-2-deoxyglucuronate dehydrogenase
MINIGFLGAGDIAAFHAEAVAAAEGGRLAAIADVVPERAAMLARQHEAAALSDLESLLSFPGLDVLYILTPPQFHAAQITAAAGAGIPWQRGLRSFCSKVIWGNSWQPGRIA